MSDSNRTDGRPPAEEDGPEEGFLRRWSRLKDAVRRGESGEDERPDPAMPATAGEATPLGSDTGRAPEPEQKVLTDEDMPPLESLGPDSDYSAFLSPGVSSDLRLKALRRLFSSPKFNIIDGLDDYCEDFTTWKPLGNIITADMKYRMQRELEEKLEKMGRPEEEGEPAREAAADGETVAESQDTMNEDIPGEEPPDSGEEPDESGNA